VTKRASVSDLFSEYGKSGKSLQWSRFLPIFNTSTAVILAEKWGMFWWKRLVFCSETGIFFDDSTHRFRQLIDELPELMAVLW